MRKLIDIVSETKISDSNLSGNFEAVKRSYKSWERLEDMGSYHVYQGPDKYYFAIEDKDTLCAIFGLVGNYLSTAYVSGIYRGNGITEEYMKYCKSHLGISKLYQDFELSHDMLDVIDSMSKRYNVYWKYEGDIEPYSKNTIDKFTSTTKKTKWQLVIDL